MATQTTATTYGIKKTIGKGTALWTTTKEWISARFVGIGANHAAKEWKTRKGAQKNADRFGGEVFTISLNYNTIEKYRGKFRTMNY